MINPKSDECMFFIVGMYLLFLTCIFFYFTAVLGVLAKLRDFVIHAKLVLFGYIILLLCKFHITQCIIQN